MITQVGRNRTAKDFRPVSNIRASINYFHLEAHWRYIALKKKKKKKKKDNANADAMVTAIALTVLS